MVAFLGNDSFNLAGELAQFHDLEALYCVFPHSELLLPVWLYLLISIPQPFIESTGGFIVLHALATVMTNS